MARGAGWACRTELPAREKTREKKKAHPGCAFKTPMHSRLFEQLQSNARLLSFLGIYTVCYAPPACIRFRL
jgi:hypothetical protein